MPVFEFELVAIVFEDPEINGQLVGIFRGSDAADARRPIIPIEFRNPAVRITSRVRRKIISGIGEKSEAEESLARVDVESVLVEEIQNTEVANNRSEEHTS